VDVDINHAGRDVKSRHSHLTRLARIDFIGNHRDPAVIAERVPETLED